MTPRFLVEPEAATDLDDAFTWYEQRARGEIRQAHVRRFPYAVYDVMEPTQFAVIAWPMRDVIRDAGSRGAEA